LRQVSIDQVAHSVPGWLASVDRGGGPGADIDVITSGHSHVPKIDTVGGVLYLNPGSAARRRFKLPITLATLEVTPEGMRPQIHDLERD
jgi:predicted phosphodiesterase